MALKQRLEEIRQIVRQEKKVVVSELSTQFGVTEETIRRDLDKLEAEGLIARTYGGAVLNQESTLDNVDFMRRSQTNMDEKKIIARLASEFLPLVVTVSADASSTVAEVLKAIGERPEMTILTYSINAIDSLRESGVRLISTGGIVNKRTSSFKGPITQKILESYYTDYVLFSCKAINIAGGIYDSNEEEVELKKTMIHNGQRVVLFVDHSKFDKVAFVKLADFSEIDILVTDRRPPEDWCAFLKDQGIELICP